MQYVASTGEEYVIEFFMSGVYHYRQRNTNFLNIANCNDVNECIAIIEGAIAIKKQREARRQELIEKFEQADRKQNFASTDEIDTLLNLTEKKIVQQCKRCECHGCKLGWICPKYWA